MAVELPYMIQMGNIPLILDRIQEAGTPPKFTHEFLKNSLGFRGSGDRPMVKVLRQLKFLTGDGSPTPRYNQFRSRSTGGKALADGLREGWADVFLADQTAHNKSTTELTQIFKGVTGAGDASAKKMAATFKALASKADWAESEGKGSKDSAPDAAEESSATDDVRPDLKSGLDRLPMTFHHDIHLHLPATSDQSVYTAIFRAIKEELRD